MLGSVYSFDAAVLQNLGGGGKKANISVTLQTSIVNLFCIMTRKPLSHRDPAKRPHYNREFGLYPCAFCILHGTL